MCTVSPSFGKTITRENAKRLYKSFMKIKARSMDKMIIALSGDNEAIRYHCGQTDAHYKCSFLDVAFIFQAPLIKKMMECIENPDLDGLIIFLGSRDKEDSINEDAEEKKAPEYTDIDGRPTLMIFPYNYVENKEENTANLQILLDHGSEHPGTGGGGIKPVKLPGSTPPPPFDPTSGELPSSIAIDDIHIFVS